MQYFYRLIVASLCAMAVPCSALAATIWDGDSIDFVKANFADPDDPANRDIIIPGVLEIIRDDTRGLYNHAQELAFGGDSPRGTEWAFSNLNGNGAVSLANYDSVNYDTWLEASNRTPPDIIGRSAVMHIIDEDIYVGVTFTAWTVGDTQGGNFGGGFAYTRTTPVPVPAAALLMASGLFGLGGLLRRKPTV